MKVLSKIRDKTSLVIVGCNFIGRALSVALEKKGFNVTLVDKSLEAFEKLSPEYKGNALLGDATTENTLAKFSFQDLEAIFILTSSDNTNIFIAQMIRQKLKGNQRIIACLNDANRSDTYNIFDLETVSVETMFAEAVSSHVDSLINGEHI